VLHALCTSQALPEWLSYRIDPSLPFCYHSGAAGASIPADWDSGELHVIPLWESGGTLTAIRIAGNSPEFIQFGFEDPNSVEVLAYSAQGVLAYLLYFLLESADDDEVHGIQQLSEEVGYRHFRELAALHCEYSARPGYDWLLEFSRSL